MATPADIKWMDAAARLASRYLGTTADNPTVGALIVDPKTQILIARGVTAAGGRPHAETQAIENAGEKARGATLFVTLEPCNHYGKTPPCVDAVIASGLGQVVIGQKDPDPRTSGKSIEKMRLAGIDVTVLNKHLPTALLHKAFFKRVETNLPFVTAKLAVSNDGMVGRIGEGNVPITGAEAKTWTHTLRSRVDAIAVGAKTANLDNPSLNVRLKGLEVRSPKPMIFTSKPETVPASLKLIADHAAQIITTNGGLTQALRDVANAGVNHLLIEGGPALLNSLLEEGLIDQFYLLESDKNVGENGQPAASGSNIRDKLASFQFLDYSTEQLGADRVTLIRRND
ncbi:bifunctional diaminohydroxyphosphoribosylaminopyrimidine deaminase/5-amino-6-(5-phosphoribosylamino)uracil reductase RibD [Maritalea porphyrae]|uniref:Riboflavin biosynthesis protein RibD n=1 Tax=Maritalea porphyrae TaxID=880732 RepID=A0ABQ5USW9_9HYPH|nr:bifunctional diaminohydroxyphosphoribosylaminopyrimidine deaminase/5-amino-6-(5-phosphoribosylamino)uracil reductase RibD [Maritalea porphyrae]GLQ18222.1 riboflavin biosynthesis protein RibD [Maritalea porphyrae]